MVSQAIPDSTLYFTTLMQASYQPLRGKELFNATEAAASVITS
jgi:hypothetical protein